VALSVGKDGQGGLDLAVCCYVAPAIDGVQGRPDVFAGNVALALELGDLMRLPDHVVDVVEGDISQLRNHLVRRLDLFAVAAEAMLDNDLQVGRSGRGLGTRRDCLSHLLVNGPDIMAASADPEPFLPKTFEPFVLTVILSEEFHMPTKKDEPKTNLISNKISSSIRVSDVQKRIRTKCKLPDDEPVYVFMSDTFLVSPDEFLYDLFQRHGKTEAGVGDGPTKRELTIKAFGSSKYG
jgi:hypothetical protein